jgi:hypothetical protein
MAKKWFQTGKKGWDTAKEEDAAAQARREAKGPRRLWLKGDTACKVTLLDNPEFFLWEHNLRIGGKFFNYVTCLKQTDTCPPCEDGDQPSFVCVATVINHRKYTDKQQKEHVNEKQLVVFKGRARQRIAKQLERRDGDLKYCVYEFSRGSGATECSTGEDFEFLKRLTKSDVLKLAPKGAGEDWLQPFDYEELLAPKSPKEIRKIMGGEVPVGSEDGEEEEGEPEEAKGKGGDDDGEKEEKKAKDKKKEKEEKKVESIEDLI